jgi:hypothetical protein
MCWWRTSPFKSHVSDLPFVTSQLNRPTLQEFEMKTAIGIMSAMLMFTVNTAPTPVFAQSSASLTCRINGGPTRTGFCLPPFASGSYSVVNIVNPGSGNFSIQWSTSAPASCAPNSTFCIFSVPAALVDQQLATNATVTNLTTGAVSTVSATAFIPATCNNGSGWYYC